MTGREVLRGIVCGVGLVGAFVPALVAAKGKGASVMVPSVLATGSPGGIVIWKVIMA